MLFAGADQRVNQGQQHDRERKGDQNAKVNLFGNKIVHDLTKHAENKDAQKIFQPAARVPKSLGNAKGVEGKTNPAQNTQPPSVGKQDHARMVEQHGYGRYDFDPENRQDNTPSFLAFFHYNTKLEFWQVYLLDKPTRFMVKSSHEFTGDYHR